jgi:membrane protein implicated in regulation of membrane protease activity
VAKQQVWLTWLRWVVFVAALGLLVWSLVEQQWATAGVAVLVLLQLVLVSRYERRAAQRREHAA